MLGGAGPYPVGTTAEPAVMYETRCDDNYDRYYRFSGWTGVDSQEGVHAEVAMNEDKSVVAIYDPVACPQYTLTVRIQPATLGGGTIRPAAGSYQYYRGMKIQITSPRMVDWCKKEDRRWGFQAWRGADSSFSDLKNKQEIASVVMDRDREVVAVYED